MERRSRNMAEPRVLGIDPGVKNLGWAVAEGTRVLAHGVFHPKSRGTLPMADMLQQIAHCVDIVKRNWGADYVVIEDVRWHGHAVSGLLSLAKVVGVCVGIASLDGGRGVLLIPAKDRGRPPRLKRGATQHERDAAALAVNFRPVQEGPS